MSQWAVPGHGMSSAAERVSLVRERWAEKETIGTKGSFGVKEFKDTKGNGTIIYYYGLTKKVIGNFVSHICAFKDIFPTSKTVLSSPK